MAETIVDIVAEAFIGWFDAWSAANNGEVVSAPTEYEWNEYSSAEQEHARRAARAAIEAMRTPTPAMLATAHVAWLEPGANFERLWQAEIDAALNT